MQCEKLAIASSVALFKIEWVEGLGRHDFDVLQDKPPKALHDGQCYCKWVVVIEAANEIFFSSEMTG